MGDSFKLDTSLGFLLIQLMRAHRQRAEVALNELGLHAGQELLLHLLWAEEGLTQRELGERMGVDHSTLSKMLTRMEQRGLLLRSTDPDDARVSRITLQPSARALQPQVLAAWADLEARLTSGLSEIELALLRRLLVQMQHNLA